MADPQLRRYHFAVLWDDGTSDDMPIIAASHKEARAMLSEEIAKVRKEEVDIDLSHTEPIGDEEATMGTRQLQQYEFAVLWSDHTWEDQRFITAPNFEEALELIRDELSDSDIESQCAGIHLMHVSDIDDDDEDDGPKAIIDADGNRWSPGEAGRYVRDKALDLLGVSFHVEAIEVVTERDDGSTRQRTTGFGDDDLIRVAALAGEIPLETATIDGREFVLYMTPYSQ
jgi:hypothetical protein